jgi:hypothetical protein
MRNVSLGLFLLCACSRPGPIERLRSDEATAKEAIQELVSKGTAALPALREAAKDPDPLVRRRAKTAIGRITGQWGSDGRVVWKRSLEEAKNAEKPILVLQLFGKFDEEFC